MQLAEQIVLHFFLRDLAADDESGIEGIWSRLEKKRSMDLRSHLKGKGDTTRARKDDISYGSPSQIWSQAVS